MPLRLSSPVFSQQSVQAAAQADDYFNIYERHFERFRARSPVMLEIGVMGGGSLAMWKD